ncbi:MAG: methyltransferase domain-containing protein, partial [Pseudomonadales bacterium]|nr:methyltransferase domain-containing protein [Pseudomonadales bacterium]
PLPEAGFDAVISRFGVMFFADPRAAFTNLRKALAPGARLAFVCWQAARANPWMAVAGAAVQPYLPAPATPPDPHAPGPFAFADADHVAGILTDAGFDDVALEDFRTTLKLADDLDEAMEFQGQVGPLARALADLEGERQARALAAAREALAAHLDEDGLKLGAACWFVSARG